MAAALFAGPVGPVAPVGPVGPVAPVAPVGPVGPAAPGRVPAVAPRWTALETEVAGSQMFDTPGPARPGHSSTSAAKSIPLEDDCHARRRCYTDTGRARRGHRDGNPGSPDRRQSL